MMTKIEAVNQLLDAIGESPVSSLTSGLPDAEKAERILDRESKKIQAKGWHCNFETDYELTPNASDKIALPDNVLRIDTRDEHSDINVTIRKQDDKRYLYDIKDQTFEFDEDPLKVIIVWFFDFEDLTYELQQYIAAHSARVFQESEMGSDALDRFVTLQEAEAWAALQDAEAEQDDANVLLDSPHCFWITRREKNRFFGQ